MFSHYKKEVLEKFKDFHSKNPHVYIEFKHLAKQMKIAGQKQYSAQAIVYRMRWNHDIATTGEPFKITNDFTSIYARLLVFHEPEFKDFFKMHTQGKSVKPDTLPNYVEQRRVWNHAPGADNTGLEKPSEVTNE